MAKKRWWIYRGDDGAWGRGETKEAALESYRRAGGRGPAHVREIEQDQAAPMPRVHPVDGSIEYSGRIVTKEMYTPRRN